MSEFTIGLLYLAEDEATMRRAAEDYDGEYFLRSVNDQWQAFLPDALSLADEPLKTWLAAQSIPLLWFYHPEDHGWGYALFTEGQKRASADVSFALDWDMAMEIVEREYDPHDPVGHYLDRMSEDERQTLMQTVKASDFYKDSVAKQFQEAMPAYFSAFGVSDETVESLKKLLRAEFVHAQLTPHQQVREFQDLLNIREMEWLSYHYVVSDEGG